jgi:hypothetical protein
MKQITFAQWLKPAFAVAAIALSMPAFAANWTREEVAAARGTRVEVRGTQNAARCACMSACSHAAHQR